MHSREMDYSKPVGKLAQQIKLNATMCEALSATSFRQDALNNFIRGQKGKTNLTTRCVYAMRVFVYISLCLVA